MPLSSERCHDTSRSSVPPPLSNKRTASPKGGMDWALVTFSIDNQHNIHKNHVQINVSFKVLKKT